MADIPTPDATEQAWFFVKWWREFFLGLAAYAAALATIKRGQKIKPVYLTSEDIENLVVEKDFEQRMQICRQEVMLEIVDRLEEHEENIINRVKELLK